LLRGLPGGRTIVRLITVLVLSLALAAPAFAQNDQSAGVAQRGGSSQERVIQQGDEDSRVSAQQEDGGGPSASGSGDCNPNYEGECLDQAGDYDCPEGEENGPNFTQGEVRVVGEDEYELDRDGDGIGCNDQGGGRRGDGGSTPRGGVDSGYGGMAPKVSRQATDQSTPLSLILGGVLFAVVSGGVVFVVVRKRA